MDQFSDDFISYENFADIKFDNILEPNFTFESPFSTDNDAYFPDLFPNTIQNLLNTEQLPRNDSSELSSAPSTKKSKPFQIIKSKKNQPEERLDYSDPPSVFSPVSSEPVQENRIMSKSKRIAKVEKAKERVLAKQNHEEFITSVDVRYIPEGYGDPALDAKTQRKMLKVIKNRISAQNSRDRKKHYMEQLEEERNNYAEENRVLKQEKDFLLERIEKMQADYELVLKENELLKAGSTSSSINMNYKCGYTADFETTNTDTATEISEKISSPLVQPVSSENSGHYSVFSVAIAALLCLLFIITGGQFGEFPMKVMENIKSPTIIRLLSGLDVNTFTEEVESSLKELNFADLPILNKIKPLMEEFEKFHGTVSQQNNVHRHAVDLFQTESLQNSAVNGDKVATLFAPAAFELSKNTPNMELEAGDSLSVDGCERGDLEKAEYLQLLVPRVSIAKLDVRGDANEMKSMFDCSRFGEENSLVEVWCKVLARRNTAISI